MRTVNVGIIGCGNLGRTHADCIKQLEGMKIVAYCDVFEKNAQDMMSKYGGHLATSDLDTFFNDTSFEAVYIATQHDSHADLSIRALEAGRHVFVEKPLGMTVEQCARIGEAVKKSGKKLFTAFKMRYFDMLWKAKELIPKPIMVTMQMMDNRWANDKWSNDPIKGGGNVLSQGCHSADILRFMVGGEPIEVYAAGGNYYQATGVVDNMAATFRFDNGVIGNLVQGDSACPPLISKFFMQIYAEGKSITLTDRLTTLTYTEAGKEVQVFKGTESGFLEENRAFLKCLQEDTHPTIDHIDGLFATLMILQAFESLKSGKPEPIAALVDKS